MESPERETLDGRRDAPPDRRAAAQRGGRRAVPPAAGRRLAGPRRGAAEALPDEAVPERLRAAAVVRSELRAVRPAEEALGRRALNAGRAAAKEDAVGRLAARSAAAGADRKESDRGECRRKGWAARAAREDAAVAAASMALPADALRARVKQELTPRCAGQPEDESAPRGPAWADAAGWRGACLRPELPAFSVRRTAPPRARPAWRRRAAALEARWAHRASAARRTLAAPRTLAPRRLSPSPGLA